MIRGDTLCVLLTAFYRENDMIMFGISQHRSFLVRSLVFGSDTFVFLLLSVLSARHLQTLCPEQQGLRTDVTFTHWEVCFLEVWKTGDRDYWRTRSLMAVCWLLNLKAFFKHYSTDYCTVAFTGFRDDQKKYTWTHTLQTFYRLFRVCSLVSQSLFTLYLHCFLSDFTQSWCLSLDVLYKFIFMSVTALTSHGAHEHIAAVWSVLQYLSIWLFCSNLGKMF